MKPGYPRSPLAKDLLDKALADGTPCLIGSADKSGHPQISPKGSVAMFDDHGACHWERSHRSSQKRIGENPYVVVYYRNAARKENFLSRRLHPLPRWHASSPAARTATRRGRLPTEHSPGDPEKKGACVIIDLDLIEQIDSTVIMKRD